MTRLRALRAEFTTLAASAFVGALLVAASMTPAGAASVGTLFFEGSLGASAPSGVPVTSFTLGMPVTTAASGAGAARQPSSLQVTKNLDKTISPKLFQAATMGQHIPMMRLVVGARTLTFQDVLVSSYRASGASDTATETITFNFTRMSDTANPPATIRTLNAPAMLAPQATPTPSPAPDTVRVMPQPR